MERAPAAGDADGEGVRDGGAVGADVELEPVATSPPFPAGTSFWAAAVGDERLTQTPPGTKRSIASPSSPRTTSGCDGSTESRRLRPLSINSTRTPWSSATVGASRSR
jgi:hypothetical protein